MQQQVQLDKLPTGHQWQPEAQQCIRCLLHVLFVVQLDAAVGMCWEALKIRLCRQPGVSVRKRGP